MRTVRTNYGCPDCGGQIVASNGKLECSKNPSHFWNDIETFTKRGPRVMYEGEKPIVAQQTKYVKVEVMVPPYVENGLRNRFGGNANETIAGALGMLAEGEVMMVPKVDLDRMKESLGKVPESSAEMCGLVYSLKMDVENEKAAKENAENDLKAYRGGSPRCVVIDLGKHFESAVSKAKDSGEPLKYWLEKVLGNGIENNWF